MKDNYKINTKKLKRKRKLSVFNLFERILSKKITTNTFIRTLFRIHKQLFFFHKKN